MEPMLAQAMGSGGTLYGGREALEQEPGDRGALGLSYCAQASQAGASTGRLPVRVLVARFTAIPPLRLPG